MQRSRMPSFNHFRAIETTSGGQPDPAFDPTLEFPDQSRLAQKEMARRSKLECRAPRQRRAGSDKIRRIELTRAAFALVAPCPIVSAVRAGADDVAVGQEPAVGRRIDLVQRAFVDEPAVVEAPKEVLRQGTVLRRRRASEVIERQAQAAIDLGL
jgi:hypothetical protein